jgi:hypothetical protein
MKFTTYFPVDEFEFYVKVESVCVFVPREAMFPISVIIYCHSFFAKSMCMDVLIIMLFVAN